MDLDLEELEATRKRIDSIEKDKLIIARLSFELGKYQAKSEEYEEVIEKMAEYIGRLDTDEDICKEINVPVNEFRECEIACKDCVKEYFRNKVKGEKE